MSATSSPLERAVGAIIGLATGDALGAAVEFQEPGSFEPLTTLVGGGPHGLPPGYWTDDTSMALCLAESLSECNGFDAADQMSRYVRWYRHGHWSSTGRCFDIGNTTRAALHRFEQAGQAYAGTVDVDSAGNGSIMRLAPVPIFFRQDPRAAIAHAANSSRTTHRAPEAVDACRYMAALLLGALAGVSKEDLLAPLYSPVPHLWDEEPLAPRVRDVAGGSFLSREPPAIRGSGYVVESLEAALWAFSRTSSFRDGCLRAVNLGHDADTTGAVYGQIAGAFYGVQRIPEDWRSQLVLYDELERLATAVALRPARS